LFGLKSFFHKSLVWITEVQCRPFDLFVLVLYGTFVGFGIWHHEPWNDEALPWVIVRETNLWSLLDLIFHNWDRHPVLFYLVLFPFVKLGAPYAVLGILNGFFAIAAAFLFVTKVPFPRVFRCLFLFSFYMLYEYSVIARPYMMALFLLFLIAEFYPKRHKRPWGYALLVALFLHSDYMVFGLGVGLTLAFGVEYLRRTPRGLRFWIPFGVMAMNAVWVFWMGKALPLDHHDYGTNLPFAFQNIVQPIMNAFSPFSGQVFYSGAMAPVALWGGLTIFILSFSAIRRNRPALIILTMSLCYLLAVFTFLNPGDYRHHGFLLLSVIFVLWIAMSSGEGDFLRQTPSGRAKLLVLGFIGFFLVAGLQNLYFVYLQEYLLPFSGARNMARAIQGLQQGQNVLGTGYVIVAKHKRSAALMPYLPGVKFWNPCTGGYAAYYLNNKALGACDDSSLYDAIQKTKTYFHGLDKILFLFEKPLLVDQDAAYQYQQVYGAGEDAFGYTKESFYLYRPQRKGGRA